MNVSINTQNVEGNDASAASAAASSAPPVAATSPALGVDRIDPSSDVAMTNPWIHGPDGSGGDDFSAIQNNVFNALAAQTNTFRTTGPLDPNKTIAQISNQCSNAGFIVSKPYAVPGGTAVTISDPVSTGGSYVVSSSTKSVDVQQFIRPGQVSNAVEMQVQDKPGGPVPMLRVKNFPEGAWLPFAGEGSPK